MSLNQKIDRHTPRSSRAGSYRGEVKRATRRKARRASKVAARNGTEVPARHTHGWAD